MIYVNSERVDLSDTSQSYKFKDIVSEYYDTVTRLKERHGKTLTLKTRQPNRKDKVTGNIRPYKPYSFPYKTVVGTRNTGEQVWIYSKSGAQIENGVVKPNESHFQILKGNLHVDLEEDPDFAFFLTKHNAVKRGILQIYDPQAINDSVAEKRIQEAKFNNLIYSPTSVLFEDISKLRLIAKKWGIENVEKRSTNELRNNLYDVVTSGEVLKQRDASSRGVAEFLDDVDDGDALNVADVMQTAIDRKVLYLDRETSEWKLLVNKEHMPVSIMMVNSQDHHRARQVLLDYLMNNPYDVDTIKKTTAGKMKVVRGKLVEKDEGEDDIKRLFATPEEVDACDNWTTIQHNAKHLDVYKTGMKKDELKEIIKEKLMELV